MLADYEFCSSQTNDAGEPILPHTAEYIIAEFRKWFTSASTYLLKSSNYKANNVSIYKDDTKRNLWLAVNSPYHVNQFLKFIMTRYPHKFKELWGITVGEEMQIIGSSHLSIFDSRYDSSISDMMDNSKEMVFLQFDKIMYCWESSIVDHEHPIYAMLSLSQISAAKSYLKKVMNDESAKSNSVFKFDSSLLSLADLLTLLNPLRELLKVEHIEIDKSALSVSFSDLNWKSVFTKFWEIELPVEISLLVKSKLFLTDVEFALLMIEYAKFMVLSYYNPDVYWPFLIEKIWIEHRYLNFNYNQIIKNLFESQFERFDRVNKDLDKSNFKDSYENTLKMYTEMFGVTPPNSIWKPYESEFELRNTEHYSVHLLRLILYHYYEQDMMMQLNIDEPMEIGETQKTAQDPDINNDSQTLKNDPFDLPASSQIIEISDSKFRENPNVSYKIDHLNVLNLIRENRSLAIENRAYWDYLWRRKYDRKIWKFKLKYLNDSLLPWYNDQLHILSKGGLKFLNSYFSRNDLVVVGPSQDSPDLAEKVEQLSPESYYRMQVSSNIYGPNPITVYKSYGENPLNDERMYDLNDIADSATGNLQLYFKQSEYSLHDRLMNFSLLREDRLEGNEKMENKDLSRGLDQLQRHKATFED